MIAAVRSIYMHIYMSPVTAIYKLGLLHIPYIPIRLFHLTKFVLLERTEKLNEYV